MIIPIKRVKFVKTRWGYGVICSVDRYYNTYDQKFSRWYGVRHLDNEDVFKWLGERVGYMARQTFTLVIEGSPKYDELRRILQEWTS